MSILDYPALDQFVNAGLELMGECYESVAAVVAEYRANGPEFVNQIVSEISGILEKNLTNEQLSFLYYKVLTGRYRPGDEADAIRSLLEYIVREFERDY